jgi:hypothetical protein
LRCGELRRFVRCFEFRKCCDLMTSAGVTELNECDDRCRADDQERAASKKRFYLSEAHFRRKIKNRPAGRFL